MLPMPSFPWILRVTALSLTLGAIGCSPSSTQQSAGEQPASPNAAPAPATVATSDRPNVVATAVILCDLTRQIARETVNLTCLVPPGTDPHVYAPSPSDRRALEDADLILYSGYDYEPGVIKMVGSTNASIPKIAVFEVAVPQPLMAAPHRHDHGAEDDHAEGEEHAHGEEEHAHGEEEHAHDGQESLAPDPHIWHSPTHGVRMVEVIRQELEKVAPEHASTYTQGVTTLTEQLQGINAWMKTQVATVPPGVRKLVTPHNSFGYFADAFGFMVKGTIEGLSTEETPSAAQLAEMVDLVKEADVPVIFKEQTTNPNLIETVARNANVTVADQPLFVEGPGDANSVATTYQEMLVTNTCTIVTALGGTCDRTSAPLN